MFALTLRGPCEADPQLLAAVGREGLKGTILLAAFKQKGLSQELAWVEETAISRGEVLSEESQSPQ